MKNVAFLVSLLAHPVVIPLYALFIIFHSGTIFSFIPLQTQYTAYLLTITGPVFIPLACLPLLKYLRLIDSYAMWNKQERIFPILITIVCFFVVVYLLREFPYAHIVRQFYLLIIILLSGFLFVTICWKMSIHMMAIGALCGFVFILGTKYFGDVMYTLSVLILLSGVLGSCRLYLKCHTPAQVYFGFLYGATFIVVVLY